MRLRSVELENWRLHSKLKINFDDKATVIYGANESGKSTIMEAFSRGLFDRSSSQSDAIRRIKPLTALGTISSSVKLEFALGTSDYIVEKVFNHRAGSKLFKLNEGEYSLIDQDESADGYLTKILETSLPSKGASRPSQWGSFQWLWAPQANRELPAAEEGDPTISLHLNKGEKGSIITTPRFQRIQSLIEEDFAKYFTKTGRPTSTSPISTIEESLETDRKKKIEYENELRLIEEDGIKLKDLESEFPRLEGELRKTTKELESARVEGSDFSLYESKLDASKSVLEDLDGKVLNAQNAIKDLKNSRKEVDDCGKKVRDAGTEASDLDASCNFLRKSLEAKEITVARLEEKLSDAEELREDARFLLDKSLIERERENFNKKLDRVSVLNSKIEAKTKEQKSLFPDQKELRSFRAAETQLEILKGKLSNNGLNVILTPGKTGMLAVTVDGERLGRSQLKAVGTESIEVSGKNLGSVKIEAKLSDAKDVKNEIKRQSSHIKETLKKYSIESSEELSELSNTQEEIRNEVRSLMSERKGIDERADRELTEEKKRLERNFRALEEKARLPNSIEKNPAQGDIKRLLKGREVEEKKTRKSLEAAKKERNAVSDELTEETIKLAKSRQNFKNFSDELGTARGRENELILKHGSAEIQDKILQSLRQEYNRAKDDKDKLEKKVEELRKGPINRIKRLELQKENQNTIVLEIRDKINNIKGGIDKGSLKGLYSKLADVQYRIEGSEEAIDREKIKSEALKFLKELLREQYRSVILKVTGPIQEEVQRLLNYVTVSFHDRIELDEYLSPLRIGEQDFDTGTFLEFEDGSSGLKEILTLCVRLAVAIHLSDLDSQCLVLDDPFIHVSSERANRMVELINEAIEKHGLQVVVLTHRPIEFSGLNGKMINIEVPQ
jgi:chromosome segregation ATPase